MNIKIILCMLIGFAVSMGFCGHEKHDEDIPRVFDASAISSLTGQQIASSMLNSTVAATITNGAASAGMYTISKSGRYSLSSDLFAAPGSDNTPIILINSSDVDLDLCGKSITLSSTIASSRTCRAAVEIASGRRNITILNGFIHGIAGATQRIAYGILNPTGGTTPNANVTLEGLDVIGCSTTGIELAYVNKLHARQVRVFGSPDNVRESINGLKLSYCHHGEITESSFSGCLSSSAVYGVQLTSCSDFEISGVRVSNNVSTADNAYGIVLNSCVGFNCKNMQSHKNISRKTASPIAAGFLLSASSENVFSNCLTTSNVSARSVASASAYGIRLENASNGNVFTECEAKGNVVDGSGGSLAAGYYLANSAYNVFDHCVAVDNKASSSSAAVLAYGFVATGTGSVFKYCRALGNSVASTSSSAACHGICLIGENAGTIQNCSLQSNRTTANGSYAYGIFLRGTCNCCVVEYNNIFSNQSNNAATQYGFFDAASDCTTFLRGNVSFGHGKVFVGAETTLTQTNTMNYFLDYVEDGSVMNIQMLIKETDISNMNVLGSPQTGWLNFSINQNAG